MYLQKNILNCLEFDMQIDLYNMELKINSQVPNRFPLLTDNSLN